jgi:exoribonuclease R
MQVKYMQDHKTKSFRVISGVTEWGIYVEIVKINVRMVRIRDIKDDYYTFDENNMHWLEQLPISYYN